MARRGGMEDQLGSLGLVLNAVALWTTPCIDAPVEQLRAEAHEIRNEDVARLPPLKHRNLNMLGGYGFTSSTPPLAPCGPCATVRAEAGGRRRRRRWLRRN